MKTVNLALVNENGLTEQQLKFASELAQKYPLIVAEARNVRSIEGQLVDKYFALCDELRKSGLNAREMTLLLQSEGFNKVRISEFKKVISVDDETWSKYMRRDLGFKATLKIARSGSDNVDDAETPPVVETQGDASPVHDNDPRPAVVPIVDPILPKLAKMLKMHKLAPGKHTALVDVDDYAVQILFTVKGKN